MTLKWNSNTSRRFGWYDPSRNLLEVDVVGLTNHELEFQLGTPSLDRREDISLIGSNSTGESIYVNLKWLPLREKTGHVQLATEVELELGGQVYAHQQVTCYQPTKSRVRLNRVMQYGASNSCLKLIIGAPYRRLRLLFTGFMQNKDPSRQEDVKFVKINFIVIPTCGVFDFLDEFDNNFLWSQFKRGKVGDNFKTTLRKFVLHDRHEQLVQIKGDCLLRDPRNQVEEPSNCHRLIYLWGLHGREFPEESANSMRRRNIFVHTADGKAFNLVRSTTPEGESFHFGYTAFLPKQQTTAICKEFKIDWSGIQHDQELHLEVSNQNRTYTCKVNQHVSKFSRFRRVQMNGHQGYGFVSLEQDVIEATSGLARIRSEYLEKIAEGRIVVSGGEGTGAEVLVVDILESSCRPELVGSKAASLHELSRFRAISEINYRVPFGVVVTRFAYRLVMDENEWLQEEVSRLERVVAELALRERKSDEVNILQGECERLRRLVEDIKLPEKVSTLLEAKLVEHYGCEGLKEQSFAVRSSSWGEDEQDMSAAGQLTTLLAVEGLESILRAVMTCFASKFNFANIQYKRQHGLPLNLPMAVLVQEMVDCEKAGVMFTCEPTNGDPSSIVITANYGLGESVVGGISDPDYVRVRRCPPGATQPSGMVVEEVVVGSKKLIIDSESLSGKEERPYDRRVCCLNESEMLELSNCGVKLAEYYQSNRDIEWGYANRQLYLLQARPVTGLETLTDFELLHEADRCSRAEVDFSTRANLGEVLPYALTPMTLTHTFRAWSIYTNRFERSFRPKRKICLETSNEIVVNSYHAFLSLSGSSMMAFRKPNNETHKFSRAFQIAFFGHEIEDNQDLIERLVESREVKSIGLVMLAMNIMTIDLRVMAQTIVKRHKSQLEKLREKYFLDARSILEGPEGESKMSQLYELNKSLLENGAQCWRNHGLGMVVGIEYNAELIELLSKYIHDKTVLFSTIGKLLSVDHQVLSAEIPQRIRKISELIKKEGHSEKFSHFTTGEALEYLTDEQENPEIAREFKSFLSNFGHRCYNEFEVAAKSWRKEPDYILQMIKKNSSTNQAGELKTEKKIETLESILSSICVRMSFIDQIRLKHLIIPRCLNMVSVREMTKDNFIAFTDILREASSFLAREMCRELRLPDEELFFYLFFDELEPLIREPQPSIVMHALQRRSMFRKHFKTQWKFDEIITDHQFLPVHLKPSPELDEMIAKAGKLKGVPASSGRVQSKVCIVNNYDELAKVKPADILVTHSTDIAYSPVFPIIAGLVTEVGGLISHGGVVAREYGLPSLIGVVNVTKILRDGEEIILDADAGTIIRLSI